MESARSSESRLPSRAGRLWVALGAGFAASACCAGPLLLVLLGMGGALAADLRRLDPARPYFTVVALAVLVYAHYDDWRARRAQIHCGCPPGSGGRRRLMLWGVTVMVLALLAVPYLLPMLILPSS